MDLNLIQKILNIWKAITDFLKEIGGLSMRMKITFGILLSLLIIAIISAGLIGCMTPQEAYIQANHRCAQTMLPDLVRYIQSDQRLSDLDKEVRKDAVNEWKKLIEQAYSDAQKGE